MAIISQLEAAVKKFWFKGPLVVDNRFSPNPLIDMLLRKYMLKHDGGRQYTGDIEIDELPVTSFEGADTIDLIEKDILTEVNFDPKYYTCPHVVKETDLLKWGKEEIIRQIPAYEKNIIKSMMKRIGKDLYGDGTTNAGKDFLGFGAIFDQTAATTYGGVSPNDYSQWKANVKTTFGGCTTNAHLAALVAEIEAPDESPTILICSKEMFYKVFWPFAFNKVQISDVAINVGSKNPALSGTQRGAFMAKLGYKYVEINGIPLTYDKTLDTLALTTSAYKGHLYCMNENYLDFIGNEKAYFTPVGEYKMLDDKQVYRKFFNLQIQLATLKRNAHSLITGITF